MSVARQHRLRAGDAQGAQGRARRSACSAWPRCCRSSICSTAARRSSPAASASAWPWAARWRATRKLFLFDEPLSNLDAKLRVEMRAEIKRLHQRSGITTRLRHARPGRGDDAGRPHRGDEATACCSSSARRTTIYSRPATRFVAEFIGSPTMNIVACERSRQRLCVARRRAGPERRAAQRAGGIGTLDVLYGLRPENVALADARRARHGDHGRAHRPRDLRADRHRARPPAGPRARAAGPGSGDAVHLAWRAEDAHLFDAKSELRVA